MIGLVLLILGFSHLVASLDAVESKTPFQLGEFNWLTHSAKTIALGHREAVDIARHQFSVQHLSSNSRYVATTRTSHCSDGNSVVTAFVNLPATDIAVLVSEIRRHVSLRTAIGWVAAGEAPDETLAANLPAGCVMNSPALWMATRLN